MAWHRCDECGKKFAFQKSLLEHQARAHTKNNVEVIRCSLCSYEAAGSRKDLELHVRLQHANSRSQRSKCNKCRKTFDSLPALIRHKEMIHPSEEQYALQLSSRGLPKSKSSLKCRMCDKALPTPFSLEQHLVKIHRSPSAGSITATSPDSCSTSVINKFVASKSRKKVSSESAGDYPVIYRVKNFKLGRSLVIIRVGSH